MRIPGVTVCSPCGHPGPHAGGASIILADRCPAGMPDDVVVLSLVHAVRAKGVNGPLTIHKNPFDDISAATGQLVRTWVATRPDDGEGP
jgi:hypothetical protein